MGPIMKSIEKMSPKDAARHKSRQIAAHHEVRTHRNWQSDDLDIRILGEPQHVDIGESGALRVHVRATRNGVELDLDNPFYFVNPPVIHDDEENLPAAFRKMIEDAVRKQWQP